MIYGKAIAKGMYDAIFFITGVALALFHDKLTDAIFGDDESLSEPSDEGRGLGGIIKVRQFLGVPFRDSDRIPDGGRHHLVGILKLTSVVAEESDPGADSSPASAGERA